MANAAKIQSVFIVFDFLQLDFGGEFLPLRIMNAVPEIQHQNGVSPFR